MIQRLLQHARLTQKNESQEVGVKVVPVFGNMDKEPVLLMHSNLACIPALISRLPPLPLRAGAARWHVVI